MSLLCLSVCLSVCLSACLPVCVSVCLYVFLSLKNICLSGSKNVCMSVKSYGSYEKMHHVNLFQYHLHEINEETVIKINDTSLTKKLDVIMMACL